MNQAELIVAVSDKTGFAKSDIEHILKATGDAAQAALAGNDEVTLPGIGKLKTKVTAARTGRNPKTGEALEISAKTKAVFVSAKALKDAIQ
ncbi:MAG: HU family DNA-binding protein [Collimonas sp.]|uniref:HU family DNA-binding protein n=1 Tax=Collimonas sp. TaxID=1963772 RepID=UPI003267ECB3